MAGSFKGHFGSDGRKNLTIKRNLCYSCLHTEENVLNFFSFLH